MSFEFEWDAVKAAENLKKHGVAFGEALTVFGDPLARIVDDPDHSVDEKREIIIGHSRQAAIAAGELHRTLTEGQDYRGEARDTTGATGV